MKITPKVSKDELWKGIIEELFEEFLHFFFPKFVQEVDFLKGYEFLDKELQELIAASDTKNRRADVLVKVFLKSGEEKWLLIHVEVQGYEDEEFPLRMYIYNYRSYDRFNKAVVALAILTDENPNFRPSYYEKETWETKIRYDFKMYKLLDYEEADFENSNNPFAAVMQVARTFIRNKTLKTDEDLLSLKLTLFKKMYEKGHGKEVIRKIANFIKLYVFFRNHEYFTKFETELDNITKYKSNMGLLELIKQRTIEEVERVSKEEGLEEERRNTITKMLSKNYSVEVIADLLEIPIEEVVFVEQEIKIGKLFQEGLTIEEVKAIFEDLEELILVSDNRLELLLAESKG